MSQTNNRDVVAPAAVVGHVDKLCHHGLPIALQETMDLAVLQVAVQPIGAEHEAIARLHIQIDGVHLDVVLMAHGPGNHVLAG